MQKKTLLRKLTQYETMSDSVKKKCLITSWKLRNVMMIAIEIQNINYLFLLYNTN